MTFGGFGGIKKEISMQQRVPECSQQLRKRRMHAAGMRQNIPDAREIGDKPRFCQSNRLDQQPSLSNFNHDSIAFMDDWRIVQHVLPNGLAWWKRSKNLFPNHIILIKNKIMREGRHIHHHSHNIFCGNHFLGFDPTHRGSHGYLHLPTSTGQTFDFEWASVMVFDFGVFMVVTGVVVGMINALSKELEQ